ncbi:FAD-binding protein [Roseospira marina]|uniref:D-lactate dehydrogenase (cytochrome) n=1 Tax=Roseospira marina TaxID=140057 RepID=A0A5M6IF27_9PROT|nr:FAD-linked oxidase C-terminal domain-containing protein [Roseospira marina]KAA5606880.1 FAD-binding protein [Roseospira marina]MBB4312952.1 D-lactate dehydrogenase (cytochrome) [Roseospira marina]MBB5086275.1 D-lactate dehydrogenase (cytochrome) [Roseospira marina]
MTAVPHAVPTSPDALEAVLEALRPWLGDRLSTSAAVREQHGRDESYHDPMPPDAVAFATSTDEVAAIVRTCAAHRVPIIPFGTGTSLEGHIAAVRGGICIDLSRMNAIVEVRPEDMDCTVQAGVTRKQLNEYLRDTGLFFPIDPGADASIGGMAATRASGTNAVRYGTMREAVLALTVVTADGRVVRTARRARKSAAGYDLTRLFVGSEGTLGVITEVTLRLHGIPECILSAVCPFPTLTAAVDTVIQTIQSAVPMARIEFLDANQMRAVNAYSGTNYALAPTLFLEFHGTEAFAREQVEMVQAIAAENGGHEFAWADTLEERNRLWQARHNAYYASLALKPGSKGFSSDVCVPISRLADCVEATAADCAASSVLTAIVGHVGDGNFHVLFMVDPDNADEIAEARALNDRIVERALSMEGTCTGEHGIGYGKMAFLEAEHGPEGLAIMRAVKQALDPDDIMNPGKIVHR